MNAYPEVVNILGRILLVSYFLKAAVINSMNPAPIINMIKSKNFPLPHLVFVGVVTLQVLGGLSVIFNFYPIIGAAGLIAFTALFNLLFCNYWTMEGVQSKITTHLFFANVAIIGGLIIIISL